MEKLTKEQFFKHINYLQEFEKHSKELNKKYDFSSNESCFSDFIDTEETYTSFYHQWHHPKGTSYLWHLDIYFYNGVETIGLRANTPEELWEKYEKI